MINLDVPIFILVVSYFLENLQIPSNNSLMKQNSKSFRKYHIDMYILYLVLKFAHCMRCKNA
jgi:hypothetical protein